jgi:hypothetical protein
MSRLTNAQIREALKHDPIFNTKSWANIVEEEEEKEAAAYAAMSPANKARHNEHKRQIAALSFPPVGVTRRNNRAARGRRPRNNATRGNRGPRRNNRGAAAWGRAAPAAAAAPAAVRPRLGKFMRECRNNPTGCARHQTTHNCKFVHSDEPEFPMLRANQRL